MDEPLTYAEYNNTNVKLVILCVKFLMTEMLQPPTPADGRWNEILLIIILTALVATVQTLLPKAFMPVHEL